MYLERKLKPDRNITGLLVGLSAILIFGIVSVVFGFRIGLNTLAVIVWAFSLFYLYVFLRTGSSPNLLVVLWTLYFGYLLTIFARYIGTDEIAPEFGIAYLTGLVFFGVTLIFLVAMRKLKWRGREIFELAAQAVDTIGNGYTSRPRPVGRMVYSPQQINGFARFCSRNLIALPYITEKSTTLVLIKMGEEFGRVLGLNGDYRVATWVNFDINGEISVHIAQKDYLDYKEPLAFDQLCSSLGQVFIDFIDLYDKGEGIRVIDRMDELNIPVFS